MSGRNAKLLNRYDSNVAAKASVPIARGLRGRWWAAKTVKERTHARRVMIARLILGGCMVGGDARLIKALQRARPEAAR